MRDGPRDGALGGSGEQCRLDLLQAAELERLAAEGVRTYDLGMDLGYKRSWADRAVPTVALVLRRHPRPDAAWAPDARRG